MILLLSITNVPHVYSLSPSPGQIVQSIVFHVWPTAFKILFLSNPMKTCYKASKILSSQPCQQLISFLPQSHIGPGSNQWEPGSSQWEPGSNQWEHIFSERDKGGGGKAQQFRTWFCGKFWSRKCWQDLFSDVYMFFGFSWSSHLIYTVSV